MHLHISISNNLQSLAYSLALVLGCGKQQPRETFYLSAAIVITYGHDPFNAHSSFATGLKMYTETPRIEHNEPDDAPLSPPFWCVVRRHSNAQNTVIAQFSSRTVAEEHLQFLAKMSPDTTYDVVFDFGLR